VSIAISNASQQLEGLAGKKLDGNEMLVSDDAGSTRQHHGTY